jgi:chorismate synthase
MSINAVKGVEVGAGIEVAHKPGSQIHDEICYNRDARQFVRRTNRAGGIEGGMSNGEEIRVRGHLKPIPTLRKALASVDISSKQPFEAAFERSDVTVLPAAGVIGEAMVALVLAEGMREKFGGDSLKEMKRNYDNYLEQLKEY